MNPSDEVTKANWEQKVEIAKQSFKEVLASDEHEDGKAQRILTAMAFLVAAASLIFAELSQTGITASLHLFNWVYIPACFFAFVAAMLIGTVFFLAALGPAFNIPRPWHTKGEESYPQSILFSQLIVRDSRKQWVKHWEESSRESLQAELAKNYVNEAYLLAEKVKFKANCMRIGKIFYKFSLGFFGMMVIPLITTDVRVVYSLACVVFLLLLAQDIWERWKSPGGSLFAIDSLIGTLVELVFIVALLVTLGIINWPG